MKGRTDAHDKIRRAIRIPFTALWWGVPATILLVLLLLIAFAVAPYLFSAKTLEAEINAQLRTTTGLVLSSPDHGRFDLLPRPRVVMGTVHVNDSNGTLTLDAESLDGDVRLLPLLVGRIELASVELTRPRIVIDLDHRAMHGDSLLGKAMRGDPSDQGGRRLGVVTLVDGTATLHSGAYPDVPAFSAVNLPLDWRDLDAPATLTGSVHARDTTAEIAAWVAQPSSIMRGDHSAVAFHVHGLPLDLSANGDVASGATTSFRGHVTASAPSVADLLKLFGDEPTLLAAFSNASLNSDVNIDVDADYAASVDLPNLVFHADGNEYEGTLAYKDGEVPALSGTLASDQLNLAPFLAHAPKPNDAHGGWSNAPILAHAPRPVNLDLRVSATHLRLPPFAIDDAALSVITRNDRTEVALAEGTAYGGAVKGRLSIGTSSDGVSLRGLASLSSVDAAALTWDMFGRQLAAGALSGGFNFEASGDSPATLMRNLSGSLKGTVSDGEITGVDFSRGLREAGAGKPDAALLALHAGRTPFRTFDFGARVVEGVATLSDTALAGEDARVVLHGTSDIGTRAVDLDLAATAPGEAMPRLGLGLKGRYDRILVAPEMPAPLK